MDAPINDVLVVTFGSPQDLAVEDGGKPCRTPAIDKQKLIGQKYCFDNFVT
jgi:hypothetical protein